MSANETTGNFDTRDELETRILELYHEGNSQKVIAQKCGLSDSVVGSIIRNRERIEVSKLMKKWP